MDVATILFVLTTLLGAASTIALFFNKSKLAKMLKAVILGIEAFSDKYGVGEEVKKEIKNKAGELGVDEPLRRKVDKIKKV